MAAAVSSTAPVNPAFDEEVEHGADENWWARQLMNFAKTARAGVWYTFDELVKHYGVPKFPGTIAVPGDESIIRMHKERIRGLKRHLAGFEFADRARQSILAVVCELEIVLNSNLALAKKR